MANTKYNFVLVKTEEVAGETMHTVSGKNMMEVHDGERDGPIDDGPLTVKIQGAVAARAFQAGGNKRRSNARRTRSRTRRTKSKVGGKRSRARRTKSKRSKSTRRR